MGEIFAFVLAAFLFPASPLAENDIFHSTVLPDFSITAPAHRLHSFEPIITAPTALIADVDSAGILWEYAANEQRPIASLTKLMTALIILENHNLNEIVSVSEEAANIEGATMHLVTGERISVRNLLAGLFIPSANDAAIALAQFHAGSEKAFVEKMNRRAYLLGLRNTHFQNPHGFDASEHYSTPTDLLILARKVLKFPVVREFAATKLLVVTSADGEFVHELNTTNELLFSPFPIIGLKTGTTDAAGQCFIGLLQKENQEILFLVLGSSNRFHDTKTLLFPFL